MSVDLLFYDSTLSELQEKYINVFTMALSDCVGHIISHLQFSAVLCVSQQ